MRPCIITDKKKNYTTREYETTQTVATFHQWGTSFTEYESGPANFPVAICELHDGRVMVVDADSIQFTDKEIDEMEKN